MKIVEPSVELLWATPNPEKQIEVAGRVCYKSEDKITNDSAGKFAKAMTTSGHHAMIEHAVASFKIITDRGISHEIVRHRIASYAQECLSGDTVLNKKGITLKQLYDRSKNSYGKTHNKTITLRSMGVDKRIIPNKIKNIFYKGKAVVFEVTTSLGYKIKATMTHKFTDNASFKTLAEFEVGDSLMVNGRPCLVNVSDEALVEMYETRSVKDIAESLTVPYRSILEKLKRLGVFKKHKNDTNKDKYNKSHTPDSYAKMSKANKGKIPWNKGLDENHPSVKKQGHALRANHHNNLTGTGNSNWKGGISQKYYTRKKEGSNSCELCLSDKDCKLEVHHIDKNRRNNTEKNLLKVCVNCHNKLHHGWYVGVKAHLDTIISIKEIGVEDVYDLEMEAPLHNYVANGFIVHNSTRYCNYSKDKFGSEISVIEPPNLTEDQKMLWVQSCRTSESDYLALLEAGTSAQMARSVLPTCTKTEIVMTANLREWRHFITLRGSQAAHPQIRSITEQITDILVDLAPNVFGDFKST